MQLKRILLLAFCFALATQNNAQIITSAQIDSVTELTLKTFDVPGIAVAVVKDGKVIHAKGYGVRSLKTKEKVNENTLFGIASNSKAFTAAALGMLQDEGKLKYDDKVTDYIPEFRMYNPYVTVLPFGAFWNHSDFVVHRPVEFTRSRQLSTLIFSAYQLPYAAFVLYHYGWLSALILFALVAPHFGFYLDRLRQFTEHNHLPLAIRTAAATSASGSGACWSAADRGVRPATGAITSCPASPGTSRSRCTSTSRACSLPPSGNSFSLRPSSASRCSGGAWCASTHSTPRTRRK